MTTLQTLMAEMIALALLAQLPHHPAAISADAKALLSRNLAARGGAEHWQSVETLRLEGAMNVNGRENTCVLWRQGADRLRLECTYGKLREVFVSNGDQAWYKGYREHSFIPAPSFVAAHPDDWLDLQVKIELFAADHDPWEKMTSITLIGTGTADSIPAHHLLVNGPGRQQEHWYLDLKTSQVVKKTKKAQMSEAQTMEYSLYHFEYRDHDGITFPSYSEADFGTALFSLTLERVEINTELPETLFASPT